MTPILISDAVERLKQGEIPVTITRQRIYQLIYSGRLSFIQRQDADGKGRTRSGNRILVDWDELSEMFIFYPKEKR